MASPEIIPCIAKEGWDDVVGAYADALVKAAPNIGAHGLNSVEFAESGLFASAVERLRGQQSASLKKKQEFIDAALNLLYSAGLIESWEFVGNKERHDYEVILKGGRISCIEAKGCLDGNNTNIFKRPANADEFLIWSLCQNPGANPRHNAWSGIHTRLSAEIIARREKVDGLIIWDMLCGSLARPCPKLLSNKARGTAISGKTVPPPCIYLFPRSVPDARNNPDPPTWNLSEIRLLDALATVFKALPSEIVSVSISARMDGSNIQRQTRYVAGGRQVFESKWTTIRRAS